MYYTLLKEKNETYPLFQFKEKQLKMPKTAVVKFCDPCTENYKRNAAVKHCSVCIKNLCFDCVNAHTQNKATKQHKAINLDEGKNAETAAYEYTRPTATTSLKIMQKNWKKTSDEITQKPQVSCILESRNFINFNDT